MRGAAARGGAAAAKAEGEGLEEEAVVGPGLEEAGSDPNAGKGTDDGPSVAADEAETNDDNVDDD